MGLGFENDGVQVQEYDYDFASDGGATGVLSISNDPSKAPLDVGCVIQKVLIFVQEAAVGSGASIAVGNSAASGVFKASAAVSGYSASAAFGYDTLYAVDAANKGDLNLSITGAPLTAGKIKVLVEFVKPNSP